MHESIPLCIPFSLSFSFGLGEFDKRTEMTCAEYFTALPASFLLFIALVKTVIGLII